MRELVAANDALAAAIAAVVGGLKVCVGCKKALRINEQLDCAEQVTVRSPDMKKYS